MTIRIVSLLVLAVAVAPPAVETRTPTRAAVVDPPTGDERGWPSHSRPAQTAPSLPDSIPLFPLPDIALFPGTTQVFHVFEPRYRAMVADALEGDRVIGMVTLRPGFENDYAGNPPVHDIGGAGVIEEVQEQSDGRYYMVLRGISRFRIESEDTTRAYRVAGVEELPERLDDEDRVRLSVLRSRLEDVIDRVAPSLRLPDTLSDAIFVNSACQHLPIPSAERQRLVEMDSPLDRADALLELLGGNRQAGVS